MKENVKVAVRRILTNYLVINNHRKTPERYAILDAVYSMNGHFTLEELGEKLSEEENFPVSRATLYNTLKLFMELRLVVRHRFQGSTRYETCYDNSGHSHQVCSVCGKVTELKSPEVVEAVNNIHLKRFRKDGFSLYIYGICSTCQAKITRQMKLQQKREENRKKTKAENTRAVDSRQKKNEQNKKINR
ncbi:MAG: transcriptional repressor [Prevotella sp.]|nr:transcriptional repressor [Prevotella sp.]